MKQTPYIIYLGEQEQNRFKNISIYEYMTESSAPEVFNQALYPIYTYYKKRTPTVLPYSTTKYPATTRAVTENTLTIFETESTIILLLQKFFPKKNIIYLNKREAHLDIERTWKILSTLKDLKEFKQVSISIKSWSKLAYAYRLNMIYGLEVKDITTY